MVLFFQDTFYLNIKNNIQELELNEQLFRKSELQNELHKNFIDFMGFIKNKLLSQEYNYVKKTTVFEVLNLMMLNVGNFMRNKIHHDSVWTLSLYEHINLIEEVFKSAQEIQEEIFPESVV